ncbi:hypothetical protein QFZ24_008416 [Streptomyces phaeochromogenes]|jgi:hypothetical protein|nr:hypothetical protein [Streptomyces phaeochromogenes]
MGGLAVEPGMKKRSMLAIASLATGFVVAAVTPSHSAEGDALGGLDVQNTLSSLDQTVSDGSLATDDKPQEQRD